MRIRMRGHTWDLQWAPKGETIFEEGATLLARSEHGVCESPAVKGKRILIREGLKPEVELETVLHELLHASAFEVLAEEFVQATAADLARALTRLGWKRD
jgi:hypothetical protein